MKKKLVLFLSLSLLSSAAFAEKGDRAISGKLSTLGAGLEYTHGINEKLNVRAGFYGASTDENFEEDGIDYKGDLSMQNYKVVADYHPWKSGFRVTGGALYANNEISLKASGDDLEIGDNTYDGVAMKGAISQEGLAPYVGIGWDKASQKKHGWSFSVDAGLAFSLDVDASLSRDGNCPIADCSTLDADIQKEENTLKDDVSDLDMFPVVSIGLSRSF